MEDSSDTEGGCMDTTFYGVLGVGPEADSEEIRAAYRERVKDHHPDVSSDPDAVERFKRITAAKETLTDPKERARYDRVGHAAYVRSHGDSSLWRGAEGSDSEGSRADGSDSAGSEADRTAADSATSGSGPDSSAGESGSRSERSTRSRRRSGHGSESRYGSESRSTATAGAGTGRRGRGSRRRRAESPPGSETASASNARASSGVSSASEASETGTDPTGSSSGTTAAGAAADAGERGGTAASGSASASDAGAANAEFGRSAADGTAASGRRRSRTRTERRSDAGSGAYATGSFWDAAESEVSRGEWSPSLSARLVEAVRTLGAWILVHLVFISVAAGTGWYVYVVVLPPAERSLALLFALVGEVGLAVILSSVHVLSRLCR